jgi:hypothetical protein
VTLVVGDNLDAVVLPDTHAAVGAAEVDTNGFSSDCCHYDPNLSTDVVFIS